MLTFYNLIEMVGEPVYINSPKTNENRWGILDWVYRSQNADDSFGLSDTEYSYDLINTQVYRSRKEYELSADKKEVK